MERQQCLELSRLLRNQMIFWEILDSGFLCLQNSYFECACELYPYGMIGIGTIFNDYKKGVIDSDDDVSVALNPDTLEQLSQPWINLKYNFDNARKDKIITQEEEDELLKIAKDTYYPKRSFEYTIRKSSLSPENITTLLNYINKNKIDIKHDDAKKVIQYIKKISKQ